MANLSIIKEFCSTRGITITKLAKDLGVSQSTLSMAIKTNSTTIDTLEKISKYFGVSASVFFGEQACTPVELDKYKKAYKLTCEKFNYTANIIRKILFPFVTNFIWNLELFYSGFFTRTEVGGKSFLGIIGKTRNIDIPLNPKLESDKNYFVEVCLNPGIFGSNSSDSLAYDCITEIIKPTSTDFLNLQRIGILDKKEMYIMSLWAKSDYDCYKFLDLYSQFRNLKEVEDTLDNSRFGIDYNDYDWELDHDFAQLKFDSNGRPIKKKSSDK